MYPLGNGRGGGNLGGHTTRSLTAEEFFSFGNDPLACNPATSRPLRRWYPYPWNPKTQMKSRVNHPLAQPEEPYEGFPRGNVSHSDPG